MGWGLHVAESVQTIFLFFIAKSLHFCTLLFRLHRTDDVRQRKRTVNLQALRTRAGIIKIASTGNGNGAGAETETETDPCAKT